MSLQPISDTYSQLNPSVDNFNFTGLTRDEIITELNTNLSNSQYKSITESALAKMMLNSFAGMVDINNYNIQRRAEESFFDTAKLKSSMIGNARLLGYDIQRPTPGSGIFSIIVKWEAAANLDNDILFAPMNAFAYGSTPFVNKSGLRFKIVYANLTTAEKNAKTYTVTPDDLYTYVTVANKATCKVVFTDNINDLDYSAFTLIQGEVKYTKIFAGTSDTNNQLGQKFQTYKINDITFSDIYGSNDYNYVPTSKGTVTKIVIADSSTPISTVFNTDADNFMIERRSLLKSELVNSYNFISGQNAALKVCLVRTAKDQTIELKFGDGNYTAIGLSASNTAIFVKYFSTLGASANVSAIKDAVITMGFSITGIPGITLSPIWYSNSISNGLDIESNESIEVNAPAIYASLDRLVSRSDYEVFLRKQGYTNVIVWGEAEERKFFKTISYSSDLLKDTARRLMNIAMFSVTRPLYTSTAGNWIKTDIELINDLDPSYNVLAPFAETSRNIYNIMVKQDYIGNELSVRQNVPTNNALISLLDSILEKSPFSIKPVYVSPFIHDFNITGTVKIDSFVNISSIRRDIQNKLYAYLNEINDFNSEIKISNLTEIINSFTGVHYSDIRITPAGERVTTIAVRGYTTRRASGTMSTSFVTDILIPVVNAYFTKYAAPGLVYSTNENSLVYMNNLNGGMLFAFNMANETINLAAYTMRNFVFEFIPAVVAVMTTANVSGAEQYIFINDVYNAIKQPIKMNMLDSNGNISPEYDSIGKWLRGGYSLGNELVNLNMDSLQIKY